jgi:hypothetical protein
MARGHHPDTDKPTEVCMRHGHEFVCSLCPVCPTQLATDKTGFVHPSLLKGRVALRVCVQCLKLRSAGRWNLADWWRCTDCQPLGTISAEQRPVWEAIHGSWDEMIARRSEKDPRCA